ncbi:MAG: NAD(P)-dependent oxidoreductase [Pseudomonadota bacterium]
MSKPTIAFLGIGLMGDPQARRLLEGGYSVTAWNRTRAKAEALISDGAQVAESAAEAASGVDIVITMLSDGPAVGDVLFEGGVAEVLKPGAIVIDMSSIRPAEAQDHAVRLKEAGVEHIDAPVSGGTVAAEAGTLSIMCGAEADVFARARPVLEAMGSPVHIGPSGTGQMAKLANQTIVGVTIGAVAEALNLCTRAGADPERVREALINGFAKSRILELHGQRMIDRDFAVRGRSSLQLKDLRNARDAGGDHAAYMPLTERAIALYEELLTRQDPDHSGLLLAYEKRSGETA